MGDVVLGLPGIVQRQGINVMMGYVMMCSISVLGSLKQMALPVMTGCSALFPTNVQVESVEERLGIVLRQVISVMMEYVMII
jgi:hypothetical protein